MEVEKINLETKFYQDKKILKIISLGFSHDNQKFLTKICYLTVPFYWTSAETQTSNSIYRDYMQIGELLFGGHSK